MSRKSFAQAAPESSVVKDALLMRKNFKVSETCLVTDDNKPSESFNDTRKSHRPPLREQ